MVEVTIGKTRRFKVKGQNLGNHKAKMDKGIVFS
jgi:hypothetical protein